MSRLRTENAAELAAVLAGRLAAGKDDRANYSSRGIAVCPH